MTEGWLTLLQAVLLLGAHLLSWWAVIHALLHKRDPRSALGWAMTALFLPGVGALLYLAFGIARAESRATQLMRQATLFAEGHRQTTAGGQPHGQPVGHVDISRLPRRFQQTARVGTVLTGRSLSGGNSLTPLVNGDEAYPVMLNAIENACDHVYLTTYIFKGGRMGTAFCQALTAAAARGVDVRVLVDGMGGLLYSWARPWKKLSTRGVRVASFLPPRLFPPNLTINLRTHRKVLVCDRTGFTGGMNIADYHMAAFKDFSAQDMHFLCSGPVVAQLEEAFLLDWGFCTGDYTGNVLMDDDMCGDSLCRMVLDGPGSGKDPLHDLLCGVIGGAHQSVRIMTPYFLPTHELTAALKSAALRGVQVHIVLPGRNNLPFVHWATLHLLPTLLEAGVRIFYQPPPFAHTKLLMVDGYYTQCGSANLDARSLRLNFELNVECFDTSFTRELEKHFDTVRRQSHEMTLAELQAFSLPKRLRNAGCWIFSPYL